MSRDKGRRRRSGWIRLLLPRDQAARYGTEIAELWEHSEHPARDAVDLVCAAVYLRAGLRLAWVLLGVSVALTALSAAVFALAAAGLEDGIGEMLRHWWSTLAVVALGVALGSTTLWAAVVRRGRLLL